MRKKLWLFIICFVCLTAGVFGSLYIKSIYTAVVKKSGIYKIFVDADASRLYVLKDNALYKTYKCAGGKTKTPSPIGVWTIVSKDRWGKDFGGYWMGFNVPWGKFGIHGTDEPYSIGWDSSHGCIRMNNNDVAELYSYITVGTTVIIEDGCFGVFGGGFRSLKPGDYGADVMEVQKRLKELGYFNGYVNGIYEQPLQDAIRRFQKANGMPVSNAIGPNTMKKLGFILME